jgi:beta-lactamase superfamily II metal-dependent hydrolase
MGKEMALRITLLKASQGDCFLFKEEDSGVLFLIDCGFKLTFKQQIRKLTKSIDFVILTHIDSDHVMGCIPMLEAVPDSFSVGKVYVNSPSLIEHNTSHGLISIKQALTLEDLISSKEIDCGMLVTGDSISVSPSLKIKILSPSPSDIEYLSSTYKSLLEKVKEQNISSEQSFESFETIADKPDEYHNVKADVLNATSIVCLILYKEHRLLFTGDGHPSVISASLKNMGYSNSNKLVLSYLKVAHHGSYHNLSEEFLSLIKCSNFIISTNGGSGRSKHPSRDTIVKFLLKCERDNSERVTFHFNYAPNLVSAKSGTLLTESEMIEHKVDFKITESIQLL